MGDVTSTAEAIVDIWPYVDAVPAPDIEGWTAHDVEHVYRHPNQHVDHVLIKTCRENCYLVILIDRDGANIIGHHFLDLNRLYGLEGEGGLDRQSL
jgi:hypothetical protein